MKAAENPDGDWQAPLAQATADLLRLSEWLAANECTHVAMEATGVYWKPVWHILDDGEFALVLANAAHVKNVPGRKIDLVQCAWAAEAQFYRIKARRGPKKAIMDVVAS